MALLTSDSLISDCNSVLMWRRRSAEVSGKLGRKGLKSLPLHAQVPDPTTWTILRHDGPDPLGLWCNALPEHQMALIASG